MHRRDVHLPLASARKGNIEPPTSLNNRKCLIALCYCNLFPISLLLIVLQLLYNFNYHLLHLQHQVRTPKCTATSNELFSATMNSPSSSELSSEFDLSSVGSLSPPPPSYPSPPSSQEQVSSQNHLKRSREDEDAPAAKKRRTPEPKPRTTQYLNLRSPSTEQKKQMDLLMKVLRKRRKIVVIAGAGISVSAGIPDFRSGDGLFTTLRAEHNLRGSAKQLFDASVYQTDASTSSFHDMLRDLSEQTAAAEPTEFHHLVAKLASDGRLMRLYTQNVDGLDTSLPPLETEFPLSSKGPWPRTVQLHGGLQKMTCSKCNHISDFEPNLFRGATPPLCKICIEADKVRTDHAGKRSHGVGKLRPRMLLYNESSPDEDAIGKVSEADLRARPDAVMVVGTTMKVKGLRRIVREMCGVVRGRKDGIAVWLNHEPPPISKEFEDCWDLVVEGSSDTVAQLANLRHWDDNTIDYKECSESDTERAIANGSDLKVLIDPTTQKIKPHSVPSKMEVKVVIESPAKKAVASSLLTPAASPRSKSVDPKVVIPPLPPKMIFPHLKDFGKKGVANKVSKSKQLSKPSTKAAGSKAKTTKSRSSLAQTSNAKISASFKVTKPQRPTISTAINKIQSLKPVTSAGNENPKPSRPMAPLSPVAARHNGPLPPHSSPKMLHIPAKISLDFLHQENRPIHVDSLKADTPKIAPPRTPVTEVRTPTSPEFSMSPHWVSARNSPTQPAYEKMLLVERLVYPDDASFPCHSDFHHTVVSGQPKYTGHLTYDHFGRAYSDPLVSTDQIPRKIARPEKIDVERRLKSMSEEIVSPTAIPGGMKHLLN